VSALSGEWGLADVARHVMGCCLNQETRVQSALDDVASNSSHAMQRACLTQYNNGSEAAHPPLPAVVLTTEVATRPDSGSIGVGAAADAHCQTVTRRGEAK